MVKTNSLVENRGCVETKPDNKVEDEERLKGWTEKIKTVRRNAELCMRYKKEVVTYVKKLEGQCEAKVFTYAEFEYLLSQYLKGHPLEYWVAYYDSMEKRIKRLIRKMSKERGCQPVLR